MGPVESKIEYVRDDLAARIRRKEYVSGQKLPSARKLARAYNVSLVTANMAMAQLKSMGLASAKRGAGTFVDHDDSKQSKQINIGVAYMDFYRHHIDRPHASHPAFIQWLRGIGDFYPENDAAIKPLCYHKLQLANEASSVRYAIERGELQGLIVTGWLAPEEVDYLNSKAMPLVLVEHHVADRQVAKVMVNRALAFRMVMKHLLDLGHRRIVFLAYQTDYAMSEGQGNGMSYVRAARAAGHTAFGAGEIIVLADDSRTPSREEYEAVMEEAQERKPTAVITFDDAMANRMFSLCLKRGIRVPGELSVASLATSLPEMQVYELTTTNMASLLSGATCSAAELLDRSMRGEDVSSQSILINPSLIVGESTGLVAR